MIPPRNGVLITPVLEQFYLEVVAAKQIVPAKQLQLIQKAEPFCLLASAQERWLFVFYLFVSFFVIFASEDYFRIYVIHKSVCRVLLMGVAQICDKLYGHLTLSHILRHTTVLNLYTNNSWHLLLSQYTCWLFPFWMGKDLFFSH